MIESPVANLTLAVFVGTLAAIVYSLRILVLVERRVARMEEHIEGIASRIVSEEVKIEKVLKKARK
jgi:hypothetical protein